MKGIIIAIAVLAVLVLILFCVALTFSPDWGDETTNRDEYEEGSKCGPLNGKRECIGWSSCDECPIYKKYKEEEK